MRAGTASPICYGFSRRTDGWPPRKRGGTHRRMLRKNLITAIAPALAMLGMLAAGCTRQPAGTAAADLATPGVADGDLGARGDLAAPPGSDLSASGLLYDVDGPEAYTMVQLTATGSGKSIPLTVYVPSTAGPRPAVLLSPGLQQPGAAYAPYARRLASYGIVAALRDDPGVLTQSQALADDIAFVVTWLPTAPDAALAGRVDAAHVALAGHSRGGMASLLAIESSAHAVAFFGIDPVDNAGSAAKGLGAIAIPTVFLGETTDSGAGSGGMACAPADQNYDVLWHAAPSPSLELTAVGADHTQFEDPASCAFCTLCTKGSADGAVVLAESVRYATAFFARTLLGDTRVDATLQSAADVAAGRITMQQK